MSDIPDLKVVEFPFTPVTDIPQKLRDLADLIEERHFGTPATCVVVLDTDYQFDVFGLGCEANGAMAHWMLSCAQRKLEAPFVKKMIEDDV